MRKPVTFIFTLLVIASLLGTQGLLVRAQGKTTITVAVVNNPDQRRLLELADTFKADHPDIDLSFVMLPENELRDRVTTDITTNTGSFDIVQIGTFETPIFAKNGWLASVD